MRSRIQGAETISSSNSRIREAPDDPKVIYLLWQVELHSFQQEYTENFAA